MTSRTWNIATSQVLYWKWAKKCILNSSYELLKFMHFWHGLSVLKTLLIKVWGATPARAKFRSNLKIKFKNVQFLKKADSAQHMMSIFNICHQAVKSMQYCWSLRVLKILTQKGCEVQHMINGTGQSLIVEKWNWIQKKVTMDLCIWCFFLLFVPSKLKIHA